jgi:predicted phosphate transport protein (TIGR00153 family)
MLTLFGRSNELEAEIESFLRLIQEAGLLFFEGMKEFLGEDQKAFARRVGQISATEHEGDELRRNIKFKLYTNMLIPESRGDVLGLLETLDDVLDLTKSVLLNLDIQKPQVPKELHHDFLQMSEFTQRAMDELASACRSFFSQIALVNDHINKVYFFESEVDTLEEKMMRQVFGGEGELILSEKMHLRDFIVEVARLTDAAESVCERLAIYTIKREL